MLPLLWFYAKEKTNSWQFIGFKKIHNFRDLKFSPELLSEDNGNVYDKLQKNPETLVLDEFCALKSNEHAYKAKIKEEKEP